MQYRLKWLSCESAFAARKNKKMRFFFFFSTRKSRLHRALSKEIDTAKIGLIAVRLHFLATQQKQLQQQNQQLQQPSASASAPVVAMATRDRAAHKEKEFIPATKLQLARSTPAVAGSGRSRSGRRRNDRSTNNNNNNAVVNSSGNSGRRHYHRRRNSDPSHHGDGSRARSPPARNTSPPVAAAVAAVAATAASAGTVAPTSTTTNSNTAKSASSAAVPPLPSSVVVPSFERVLTRRVDPALMPTTKRVCVMCETWLSGGAVEVPADADVFAHVSCLRCESCSLPVIDERKLKHLSAVSCFKKPGEHVFRCDVCSNGARSQRGR